MKVRLVFISASIAAATLFSAAPAGANDDLHWSVTIGSAGYPLPAVHVAPRLVYEHVQPVVVERRTIVPYGRYGRYGHPHDDREGRRYGHYRDHHHQRHHH